MVISNDASLRGRCKAIAKRHGVMAQDLYDICRFVELSVGNLHTDCPKGNQPSREGV